MRRYKVLIIGPTPPPYTGMSIVTDTLLNSSLKDKFYIIHLDTADKREIRNMGKLDLVNLTLAFKHFFKFFFLYFRYRPDLVYLPISQNILGYLRDSLFLIPCHIFGVKTIVHLHGGYFKDFYDTTNLLMKKIIKFTLANVSRVIVLGVCLRDIFRGLVPEERIYVVSNGVEDYFDEHIGRDPQKGGLNILFLSNFLKEKGIFEVLEIVPSIASCYDNIRFIFAGEWSSKSDERRAMQFIKDNRIERHIKFFNKADKLLKKKLLCQAHIFVLPTYYAFEGQPLVILEAMSAGLPVVTTRKGAIEETVKDGENGFLVKIRDSQHLKQNVMELISHPDLIERIGRHNRDMYLKSYTKDIFVDNLYQVMVGVLQEVTAEEHRWLAEMQRILIVGYSPPPQEGTAKMTEIIVGSAYLKDKFDIEFLSLKKRTDVTSRGKFGLANISYNIGNLFNYIKLIIKFRPHIIHMPLAQNRWGFLRDSTFILIGNIFRRRIYAHFHGGNFNLFYLRQEYIFRKYIIFTLQHISRIILLARKFSRQFSPFFDSSKITFLYNCVPQINSVHNYSSKVFSENNPARVLFIGYLSKAKGALDLVKAIPKVISKYKNPVEFILCGQPVDIERNIVFIPDPNFGYSRIKEYIREENISKYISIRPEVQFAEKSKLLSEASIFVFPSYSEGCGLVALEAMSFGLPLIVTPVGALEEMLEEGRNCLFVNPGDVTDLADKIILLLNSPKLCKDMGEQNMKLARERYNPDIFLHNLADIWGDSINTRQSYAKL